MTKAKKPQMPQEFWDWYDGMRRERDLSDAPQRRWTAEQKLTATTGWGARFLAKQERNGGWGGGLYSPKWTSTVVRARQGAFC